MNRSINEVSSQDPRRGEDGTENTIRGLDEEEEWGISSSEKRRKEDKGGNRYR